MSMDMVEEVRAMVVAIPTGCVATYGEIGRAPLESAPGRRAGPFRYLTTTCRRGALFTPTARRRRAVAEKLERCSKQKAFRSVTATST
jgi:hypothetical protein